ncbi:hypothetical protein Tco_0290361 [Tanacetum coccineum]
MEEINNFQQEPDESLFRAWERFKELLMKCPQHYLTAMQEVILFYKGLDVPTRQILDSRGAIPTKTATDANVVIQEMDIILSEIARVLKLLRAGLLSKPHSTVSAEEKKGSLEGIRKLSGVNTEKKQQKHSFKKSIRDKHLLSFHDATDAKTLWSAIKARFGGNEASKKMQKNLLKQQFETFTIGSREELDSAYESCYNDSGQTWGLDGIGV